MVGGSARLTFVSVGDEKLTRDWILQATNSSESDQIGVWHGRDTQEDGSEVKRAEVTLARYAVAMELSRCFSFVIAKVRHSGDSVLYRIATISFPA